MSDREEFEKWYANNFNRRPTEVGYETDICWQAWQAAREQAVPECPYSCGWQNLQSIITKNAAYFARETIDDDFPEGVMQSGIASGQYALELCRFARRLPTPAAPQADEWVKCSDRLPTEDDEDCLTTVWVFDTSTNSVELSDGVDVQYNLHDFTHWKPTGLTRPQPPKTEGASE